MEENLVIIYLSLLGHVALTILCRPYLVTIIVIPLWSLQPYHADYIIAIPIWLL